jgi:hypothetical protein
MTTTTTPKNSWRLCLLKCWNLFSWPRIFLAFTDSRDHCYVNKTPSLVPILRQINPIHTSTPYIPKIHFHIILSFASGLRVAVIITTIICSLMIFTSVTGKLKTVQWWYFAVILYHLTFHLVVLKAAKPKWFFLIRFMRTWLSLFSGPALTTFPVQC